MENTLNEVLFQHKGDGYGSAAACEDVRQVVELQRRNLAVIGKAVILTLAAVHLLKELFQLTQVSLSPELDKSD